MLALHKISNTLIFYNIQIVTTITNITSKLGFQASVAVVNHRTCPQAFKRQTKDKVLNAHNFFLQTIFKIRILSFLK